MYRQDERQEKHVCGVLPCDLFRPSWDVHVPEAHRSHSVVPTPPNLPRKARNCAVNQHSYTPSHSKNRNTQSAHSTLKQSLK